jgi:predicted CoA-binding protein
MPPTVAILGASNDRAKFGNISVRAHQACGYHVYPVNPKGESIEGLPTFVDLTSGPEAHVTRISVYLAPDRLLGMLDQIAAKPHDELWLNPGTESAAVLSRARELGLQPITGCSIVDLGVSPADFR